MRPGPAEAVCQTLGGTAAISSSATELMREGGTDRRARNLDLSTRPLITLLPSVGTLAFVT